MGAILVWLRVGNTNLHWNESPPKEDGSRVLSLKALFHSDRPEIKKTHLNYGLLSLWPDPLGVGLKDTSTASFQEWKNLPICKAIEEQRGVLIDPQKKRCEGAGHWTREIGPVCTGSGFDAISRSFLP